MFVSKMTEFANDTQKPVHGRDAISPTKRMLIPTVAVDARAANRE
jgi:hypothetical protein